jgi:hypothetical protein
MKPLVLLKVVDAGMHYDPPNPSLKSSLVLKSVYLGKYFNKSFLKHILRIFPVMCISITDSQHLRAKPVKQFPLGSSLVL